MVMLAGPNGSGKSTVTDGLKQRSDFPKLYINADNIARVELAHLPASPAKDKTAADLAESRRRGAIRDKRSFAFETVMSTPGKLALIDEAKAQGFSVDLIFVTTEDAAVNQARVEQRVALGGHPVDAKKISDRYERAMALLPAAVMRADACAVFDNTVNGEVPKVILSKSAGKMTFEPDAPAWSVERVIEPIRKRQASSKALIAATRREVAGALVTDADVGGNKKYSGCIVGQSAQHVLQRIAGTEDQFVLHDRTLCGGRTFEVGKASAISYEFGVDGKHRQPGPKQTRSQSR